MTTAFEGIAERYQDRIFSFARYLLSNREEAEEVTQEVLIRLWRHQDGLDVERVGSWLLRVTRNACYDLLRSRRSANRAMPQVSLEDEEAAHEVAGPERDPESLAQTADFKRALAAALRELAEPYKSVVVLHEVQGLPHHEIAEALGIPEVTVRVHLHRGRKKLREQLREVYQPWHHRLRAVAGGS
jgi:RNA polymerase sigma-70 factor (ECF subfamily)